MVRVMVPKAGGGWERLDTGVTDHGALTDLGGNPHPQYLLNSDADPRYVNRAGDTVTGQVETVAADGIYMHRPGATHIRLKPMTAYGVGVHGLRVENPSNGALAPVEFSGTHADAHATSPGHARLYRQPRISGPHGGPNGWGSSGYHGVAVQSWTAMPGGALQTTAQGEPGRYRIFVATYLAITGATQAHNTMYLGILVRWSDGAPIQWRNHCAISDYRFTVSSQSTRGYTWGFADGWIENRPGHAITYCGAAYAEAAGATYQFGNNYRAGHEFWPYNSGEGGLGSGWINYPY